MLELCRCCCHWTESFKSMDCDTASVVLRIFGIKFQQFEFLPNILCEQCITLLDCCNKFYDQIKKAEATLLKLHQDSKLEVALSTPPDCIGESLHCYMDIFYDIEHINAPITEIEEEQYTSDSGNEERSDEGERASPREQLIDLTIVPMVEEPQFVNEPFDEDIDANATLTKEAERQNAKHLEIRGYGKDKWQQQHARKTSKENDAAKLPEKWTHTKIQIKHLAYRSQGSNRSRSIIGEMDKVVDSSKKISHKCYICDQELLSKNGLHQHLLSHESLLPYHCKNCSTAERLIEIRTIVALNNHFETHTHPHQCSQCPLRFRSITSCKQHASKDHTTAAKAELTCHICGAFFVQQHKLRKHIAVHRILQTERYKCKSCSKLFQSSTLLRRHELIHSDDMPFKCPFCSRCFNHASNFEKHKMRHMRDQFKELPCKECNTKFTNVVDWKRHMHEHFPKDGRYWTKYETLPKELLYANSYPRTCVEPGCSYYAPRLDLMWLHYRMHYKMFECNHCRQRFSNNYTLERHIEVVHLNVRKHECTICGKRYAYGHKLREHINWHYGVQNKSCKYCPKTFTFSGNLTLHERKHTGFKPYSCEQCGECFTIRRSLTNHQKHHQSTDPKSSQESTAAK
ncbi:zinc finger protein ZFP2-like [Anopheles bellator]|uniref:zinc finger protein ZFP2-like n=1 Tax=Anopheles bellator TaxID=139047 RepID=UPI002649EEEC|nr:zinc finger protein ZFP2-like [Anopheles bellator]